MRVSSPRDAGWCFSLSIAEFKAQSNWHVTIIVDDQPEQTVHLKRRKIGRLAASSKNRPTWCFRSVSPSFGISLSKHGTSRVSTAPLELDDTMPRGKDVKRTLTFSKLEVVLVVELCAMNFGRIEEEEGAFERKGTPISDANALLLSLVCDVHLLELRGLEKDVAQVGLQVASAAPCFSVVEETKGRFCFVNGDCSFYCDTLAPDFSLKIAIQDKKGETVKSALLPLELGLSKSENKTKRHLLVCL